MDATVAVAVATLAGAVATGLAAMYGSRQAGRAQREGGVITGYDSLTQKLVAERDKSERHQEAAAMRVQVLELEIARLRLLVQQLGGRYDGGSASSRAALAPVGGGHGCPRVHCCGDGRRAVAPG